MVQLARLVEHLARPDFEVVVAPHDADADVTDMVIHDPYDYVDLTRGNLVLAPGIDLADAVRLVERMGAAGAAALLVKPPLSFDASLVQSATRSHVTLVSLSRGIAWRHAVGVLTTVLTQENFGLPGERYGGVAGGDLFAVANAIALVLDSPITIEDHQSRLLAYSSRQEEADDARAATILARRVPEHLVRALRDAGVFRRLVDEAGPIVVSGLEGVGPRAAIAVRSGDEVIGSIWAALDGPLDETQRSALSDAARVVALHILRSRAGADVDRRIQADLLATVLEGRGAVDEAATRLGLSGKAFRVLAFAADSAQASETWGGETWDALALHLSTLRTSSAAALLGGVLYAVLPVDPDPAKSRAQAHRIARSFLERSRLRWEITAAIGGSAVKLQEISRSRVEADQVLRVLRHQRGTPRIADLEDTQMRSLLLRLADLVTSPELLVAGKLGALRQHDAQHNTSYVESLAAYLDCFGDVSVAAQRLHIHANTLRYRVNKLQEISGIDLADPAERLDLLLQQQLLRILADR